jgi:hypothetical protein
MSEKEKLGVYLPGIDYRDRKAIADAIRKAMWSEKVDENLTLYSVDKDKLLTAFKETVEKPLILSSRSFAEENYIVTCNEETNQPEALFAVPEEYMNEAENLGKILKTSSNGLIGAYFDVDTRLPIPATCKEVKETAEEVNTPVLNLTAPPPPPPIVSEAKNYKEGDSVWTPALPVQIKTVK